jgi:hypothetical protein
VYAVERKYVIAGVYAVESWHHVARDARRITRLALYSIFPGSIFVFSFIFYIIFYIRWLCIGIL